MNWKIKKKKKKRRILQSSYGWVDSGWVRPWIVISSSEFRHYTESPVQVCHTCRRRGWTHLTITYRWLQHLPSCFVPFSSKSHFVSPFQRFSLIRKRREKERRWRVPICARGAQSWSWSMESAISERQELAKLCSCRDWSKAIRVLDSLLAQSCVIQDIWCELTSQFL